MALMGFITNRLPGAIPTFINLIFHSAMAVDEGTLSVKVEHGVRETVLDGARPASLGDDLQDPEAEHKRTDFITVLTGSEALNSLARSYKYWIALTDYDGFRIDTLKQVNFEEARNFCGQR